MCALQNQRKINLEAWNPPVGSTSEVWIENDDFLFYTREMMIRGDADWPPSICSYWGHYVPLPNIELQYIGRGRTFLKVLVTFKKRKINKELGLLEEYYAYTVPAWQGTNNILHLIEEIPGETILDLDMREFYQEAEDIDTDYLTRMRRLYGDDEITLMAHEVFYYPDPTTHDDVMVM